MRSGNLAEYTPANPQKALQVLVLEDDAVDFELLVRALRTGGLKAECRRIEREEEFIERLSGPVDIILADFKLPGWDAFRALEIFRASNVGAPFIVVSGAISEEVAAECIKRGASDYLLKDRLGRLASAVTHAIEERAEKRLVESLSRRLIEAQEAERRRISHELHDEVGQSMMALLLELKTLNIDLPEGHSGRSKLQRAIDLAERTATSVRDIALLLRPSMLDLLGLIPALHWQASEVSRRRGLAVDVEASDECNLLPDDYRTCLYRLVQETLNNAGRHAGAKRAWVKVSRTPEAIRVVIRDDGKGFDPRHHKGLGILGMEERARSLGGKFVIDSAPGRGTEITIELPFARPQRTAAQTVDGPARRGHNKRRPEREVSTK